jgi:hypothetical protein
VDWVHLRVTPPFGGPEDPVTFVGAAGSGGGWGVALTWEEFPLSPAEFTAETT